MKLRLLAVPFMLTTLAAQPVDAARVQAGTGWADATANVAQAVTDAKTQFGAGTPKVIIVLENTGDGHAQIVAALQSGFGNGVPIVGAQETNKGYTPFATGHYTTMTEPVSIAVMALGGDAIEAVTISAQDTPATYEDPNNLSTNDRALLTTVGKTVANRLSPVAGRKNLIFMDGAMHTPINESVTLGMKQHLGSPLPADVKMIGLSGSYWGNRVYDGAARRANTSVLAVMITGTFDWAFTGEDQEGPDTDIWHGVDPVPQYNEHFAIIKNGLGGSPDAVFHVIGHPQRSTWSAISAAADAAFGVRTATIGTEGGSEIGHLTTNADVSAVRAYFFIAAIKGNGASVSDAGAMTSDGGKSDSGGTGGDGGNSGGVGGETSSGGQSGAGGSTGGTPSAMGGATALDASGGSASTGATGLIGNTANADSGCSCRLTEKRPSSSAAAILLAWATTTLIARRRTSAMDERNRAFGRATTP